MPMSQAIPTDGGASGAAPTVLDVLGAIRMSVAQLRLYPKDSPQVVKAVSGVHQLVTAFMGDQQTLVLAGAPEGLLINGKPLQVRDATSTTLESSILSLLQEAGIKSFRIPWGVQNEELITFLHSLAKEFWGLTDGKEINRDRKSTRLNS